MERKSRGFDSPARQFSSLKNPYHREGVCVTSHHQYTLRLYRNGISIMNFPLVSQRIVIGKSPSCDLTLNEKTLRDEHAILVWRHETWHLRPLGLVSVDGVRLEEERVIDAPMSFEIGSWMVRLSLETSIPVSDEITVDTKILDPSTDREARDSRASGPFVLRFNDLDQLPKEYKIRSERVLIGKSKLCDLCIADEYLSSRHCEIYFDGTAYHLRDLQSTNGTTVNGLRVKDVTLEEGSLIVCGETKVQFAKVERSRARERRYHWTRPLLGQSDSFHQLADQIERIAPLSQNVFIHGETGTGKELVAAALHELSLRKQAPFVAINCGAISKDLMESELFGHEKGAFTGAQQRRAGAFEMANGGTLFLDEIGELPIELQPKLLRVLETGRFRRLGGREEITVDVRVFSATHRDLNQSIRNGRFREDLFYRLYVLPINVPSLRERLDDIPLLVTCFVKQACAESRSVAVSQDVWPLLQGYRWPGNIRELRNLVYRALAFCDGDFLKSEHIASLLSGSKTQAESEELKALQKQEVSEPLPSGLVLSPIKLKERDVIVNALRTCEGNQSLAAKQLGICRTTLYYKIKEYGIDMRRRAVL